MLIVGDIFAVRTYRCYTEWRHILRLLPWALIGIFIGLVVGYHISDHLFKKIMAVCLLIGIAIMVYRQGIKEYTFPKNRWFPIAIGIFSGFASMMGHTAGPVMAVYLLAMRLPKFSYVGTAAWFFFMMNLIKVPIHVLFWKTIDLQSLAFGLLMVPAIISGMFLGIRMVKIIAENKYRVVMVASTVVSTVLLLK